MAFVHFIPDPYRMYVVVALGYLVIVMNIHPIASVAAGTQMALTALYPISTLEDAIFGRLFLVFTAVTFVMMLVFVLMRTQRSTSIKTKIKELERIDARLAAHIHQGLEQGHVSLWRTAQLLYYLHMNAWLLEELADNLDRSLASYSLHPDESPKRKKLSESDQRLKTEVERVLQVNYQFTMDAEHAVMLLDPRRIPEQMLSEEVEASVHEPLETCSASDLAAMLAFSDEGEAVPLSTSALDHADADTTARIRHIGATAERLDEKIQKLEDMHVLEDIPDRDIFGTTDQFSVIADPDQPELTVTSAKRHRQRFKRVLKRNLSRKKRDRRR